MVWIKIKDLIINLNNVKYVERFGKKVLIYPNVEINFKTEEKAEAFFNTIMSLIKLSKEDKDSLVDLTDFLEEIET
jgi:hypothetical protein